MHLMAEVLWCVAVKKGLGMVPLEELDVKDSAWFGWGDLQFLSAAW